MLVDGLDHHTTHADKAHGAVFLVFANELSDFPQFRLVIDCLAEHAEQLFLVDAGMGTLGEHEEIVTILDVGEILVRGFDGLHHIGCGRLEVVA